MLQPCLLSLYVDGQRFGEKLAETERTVSNDRDNEIICEEVRDSESGM